MILLKKYLNRTEPTVIIVGRPDTIIPPRLDAGCKQSGSGIEKIVLDGASPAYISCAALCVLLTAQTGMSRQSETVTGNTNKAMKDIFQVTGYIDIQAIGQADNDREGR